MEPGASLLRWCAYGHWACWWLPLLLTLAGAKRNTVNKQPHQLHIAGPNHSMAILSFVPHKPALGISPLVSSLGVLHEDVDIHAVAHNVSTEPPITQAFMSDFFTGLNRSLFTHFSDIEARLGIIEEELLDGVSGEKGGNRSEDGQDEEHRSPIWEMMGGTGIKGKKKKCTLDKSQEHIVTVTTASLLIGFVAFAMCLVYMLNFPDPQVQSYSFKMMSSVTSIMCAVLIEKAQFGCFFNGVVIQGIFGSGDWGIGKFIKEFLVNFVIFLLWVVSISVVMKKNKDSHQGMFAANQLLSHEAAFVGIEMIITPQADLFAAKQADLGNPLILVCYLSSFAGSSILLVAVFRLLEHFRHKAVQAEKDAAAEALAQQPVQPGPEAATLEQAHDEQFEEHDEHGFGAHHDHGEPHWVIESEEAEEECAAIILSLMTRQIILFCILGRVPTKKGDFARHDRPDFGFLFGAIIITLVLLIINGKVSTSFQETCWLKHKLIFMKHYLAFTVGWLVLSLARWSVQTVVMDKTLMFITTAVGLSVPLVLTIVLVDFLCDEGWISENSAMIFISCSALCIGLSWECAIASSIDTINKVTGDSLVSNIAVEIMLCCGLCLLLLPGWKAYVVPKACAPLPKRESARMSMLQIIGIADKAH